MFQNPYQSYEYQRQTCPCCGRPYYNIAMPLNPGPGQNPNPGFNPMMNPNYQRCRNYCFSQGLTPGTAAWRNCVHRCVGI